MIAKSLDLLYYRNHKMECEGMEKSTIKNIAQLSGVSIGTVDRALNNRGRINEETKRRVLEAAASIGYRPNRIASALGRSRRYRIASITPANPLYFHQEMQLGILDAQKELSDYGVDVDMILCDRLTVPDQIKLLEAFDREKYDGLALNASGDALNDHINSIVDSGIPVVTFNSDAVNSKRLFYVGEAAYKSGQIAGDMMGRMLGGKGKVGSLISFFNPGASLSRYQGFCDTLRAHYPDIVLTGPWEYQDSDELARMAVENAFACHPDLNGLFSNSANGTVFSGAYVQEHGLADRVTVVGYDVTKDVEHFLLNGSCTMVIDQEPRKQSYYGVKLLAKHLLEKWKPDSSILEIRVQLVMRYNAADHSMQNGLNNNTKYIDLMRDNWA